MTVKRKSFHQPFVKSNGQHSQRPINRSKPLQLQWPRTSRLLVPLRQKLLSQLHTAKPFQTKMNQMSMMRSTLWPQITFKKNSQRQIAISGCVIFIGTFSHLRQDFTRIRTGYNMPAKSKSCWRKQTLTETTLCS